MQKKKSGKRASFQFSSCYSTRWRLACSVHTAYFRWKKEACNTANLSNYRGCKRTQQQQRKLHRKVFHSLGVHVIFILLYLYCICGDAVAAIAITRDEMIVRDFHATFFFVCDVLCCIFRHCRVASCSFLLLLPRLTHFLLILFSLTHHTRADLLLPLLLMLCDDERWQNKHSTRRRMSSAESYEFYIEKKRGIKSL